MKHHHLFLLLLAVSVHLMLPGLVRSYTVPQNNRRRLLLSSAASSAAALLPFAVGQQPSWAIDDVKDPGTALRILKAVRNKFNSDSVKNYIIEGDYLSLQQVLRVPPISNVRKASSTVIKREPDVEPYYRKFVAQLEKLDSLAMVAQRGKTIKTSEMQGQYDSMVAALSDFVDLTTSKLTPVSDL